MKQLDLLLNKKYFLLFVMVFAFSFSVNAKVKPVMRCGIEVLSNHSDKGKLISFKANASSSEAQWIKDFHIENGTDERVFIEWENARIKDSRIVFGDDSRLTMKNPKADEAVTSHGKSISRDITGQYYVESSMVLPLLHFGGLKKELGKTFDVFILIPIKFSDNTVEDYKLKFSIWYEMPQETE